MAETRLDEIMSTDVRAFHPDDETDEVTDLMSGMQMRRKVLVDQKELLIGIVALGDFARGRYRRSSRVAAGVLLTL